MSFLSELQQNDNLTYSENGAAMHQSTFNSLLDFNFKISSYRNNLALGISDWIEVLYDNTIDITTKIKYLFYLRDAREGIGERDLFRRCIIFTFRHKPEWVLPIIQFIPEYGRWDDLVWLADKEILKIVLNKDDVVALHNTIKEIIRVRWLTDLHGYKENKPISLMAKWLPSINASSEITKRQGKMIAKILGLSEAEYRKSLSLLRGYLNVVEKNLSAKTYDLINYSQVPSKAALLYKNAFSKNDTERYMEYLEGLRNGTTKVNASVTMPYEILSKYCIQLNINLGNAYSNLRIHNITTDELLEQAWKNIPCEDISNTLVVCDSSGSMCRSVSSSTKTLCIEVSNALAIFFAEHSKGEFKDKFITFSSRPQFVDLSKCNNLAEKIHTASLYDDCSNTDLYKVFKLILDTAIKGNMKQEDLPKNILIVSDMHIDSHFCSDQTFMESIRKEYEDAGYTMPCLIWWNLTNRATVFPEIKGNIKLVSGFSANNYKMIMNDKLDPWQALLDMINSDRYKILDTAWES